MRQARTCGRVQAPGPTPTCLQVLQNSHVSGHRMFMSRVKTLSGACQREIAVDKIREKKNYRECINITTRTAAVHCDGLSATRNGKGAAENFSMLR